MQKNYVIDEKVKKLAVWLQLNPGQELLGEGIGMHLARLIQGYKNIGNIEIELVAPAWSKKIISEYLWMYNISEFVGVKYLGIQLKEQKPSKKPTPKKKKEVNLSPYAQKGNYLANNILSRLPGVMLPIIGILPAIFLSLAKVFMFLFGGIFRHLYRLYTNGRNWTLGTVGQYCFEAMAFYIDESDDIDAVIVPIGNWGLCTKIKKKPICVQIPDIVFLEFPEIFDKISGVETATSTIIKVADHATRVICPSQYIKEIHHEKLGVPERKSKAVLHAPMLSDVELKEESDRRGISIKEAGKRVAEEFLQETLFGAHFDKYLPVRIENKKLMAMNKFELRKLVGSLRSHMVMVKPDVSLDRFAGSLHWLTSVSDNWSNRQYTIYFPTQNRPYKNIYRLICAIEILKKQYNLNIVLLLTGDLSLSPSLIGEIMNRDLYANVIALPRLSAKIHAAMYSLADLVVAASLFEGGFPFLFSEALSVDTPVVMAKIPVTTAVLDEKLWDSTLFDPRNVHDIVERILYGINNSNELLSLQKPIFDAQKADRNWSDVAYEYYEACVEGVGEFEMKKATKKLIEKRADALIEASKNGKFTNLADFTKEWEDLNG